jgi:hypothetical protein
MMSDGPVAFDADETLAEAYTEAYAWGIDTKPHHAYCERPGLEWMFRALK